MIQIFVEVDENAEVVLPDYEASVHGGDFDETVRRLQNTCVKLFEVGIRASDFLRYWMTQETALVVVNIGFVTDLKAVSLHVFEPVTTDNGLLDSIVSHLRPRNMHVDVEDSSWRENGYNNWLLGFLVRDSLLNSLQTCHLIVSSSVLIGQFLFGT